jgi:pimeloyl-ACP methyl ester carboxylesterase
MVRPYRRAGGEYRVVAMDQRNAGQSKWRGPEFMEQQRLRVTSFLDRHTPASWFFLQPGPAIIADRISEPEPDR